MDAERLKKLPLFEDLSNKQLQRIAAWTDEIDLPAGAHVIEQGDFAHEFLVIEEGTADVSQDGRVIAALGPGDFFGEIALVEKDRRTASVTTTSPMRAVVMFRREFAAMELEMPEIAEQILQVIRARRAGPSG
jgi:CRP-like cAMP-binding protein